MAMRFSDEDSQAQDEQDLRRAQQMQNIPASKVGMYYTPTIVLNAIFLVIIAVLVFSLAGAGNLHAWVIILCTGGIIINSQYSVK